MISHATAWMIFKLILMFNVLFAGAVISRVLPSRLDVTGLGLFAFVLCVLIWVEL